ncbi:hypothetical protein SARC_00632 [Sphaeroforma arctica JP610]|uniref:DUF659 domain-containing protein n=1 Tax=Sphaeroforma arctica JP610 TaxID=667725 RepID=A0A0L0GED1_9EUKA|nr:hypothetical protein SARC_00632 [Sphaeroforma arctica JP610]KNC87246.1 hypothetical protein SARC_00632 [Sphaeroforma arctica JP610]|eukprot:XP_014161148.1 hypothetical protein SARC_00632 [Sphaeroforma arctica JP610]
MYLLHSGHKLQFRDWFHLAKQVPDTLKSRYNLPAPATVCKYLPFIKAGIRANALRRWHVACFYYNGPFVAVESDLWKDANGTNWPGLLVHFNDPETFVMQTVFIGLLAVRGGHSGKNLVEWQRDILNDWIQADKRSNGKLDLKQIFFSGTPDNAANVMKAMRDTALYTLGCLSHKVQLCLKNAVSGDIKTASNQVTLLRGEGLHNESEDLQIDILERIINMDTDLADLASTTEAYDTTVIEALITNIATRAAYFNKSTVASDKLALAQQKIGHEVKKVRTNGSTRWLGLYPMAKRDNLIDPAVTAILEDPLENRPSGLWYGRDDKNRKNKCESSIIVKTLRRQFIGVLWPLMVLQIRIQTYTQCLADANEKVIDCLTTTSVQGSSKTSSVSKSSLDWLENMAEDTEASPASKRRRLLQTKKAQRNVVVDTSSNTPSEETMHREMENSVDRELDIWENLPVQLPITLSEGKLMNPTLQATEYWLKFRNTLPISFKPTSYHVNPRASSHYPAISSMIVGKRPSMRVHLKI